MVGKWTKFDNHGRAVDVIAIKQSNLDDREVDEDGHPTVPTEAALVKALMKQGCRNVASLREVRFFDCDRPKWRLYLEYYRYGTLHDLIKTYKARKERDDRDERIPEAFVWQAFNDFAQACYHMKVLRLDSIGARSPRGDHFVLHLDLKGENVLLGDAPGSSKYMPYPTLKVADWGMAEYTSLDDDRNSKKWKNYGTIVWMPPNADKWETHNSGMQEQRDSGRYGESWDRPILGNRNAPFSMKHVVWQIGANIYGLMTTDMHNKHIDEMVKKAEGLEHTMRKNGYSALMGYRSRYYSSELTSLVEDCLRVDPSRRPNPYELVKRTQDGLARYTQRYQQTGEYSKLRV
ncbi:serine/threonine protein kinase [Cladophialophora psammophila CBS 110553]|uniref:Serine/threonine protein kinase n=1 Tax=Cladophialophora psammophila CBS 110553 TaxID=1182543 RepID=W9XR77_9EURO|nr:serine/threonine protein kinase [Cladophialophora psammophila CBS 110553]EXJ72814.1 serine/threonine protein kinase [Cladophialophora psammophila CBS 110553]